MNIINELKQSQPFKDIRDEVIVNLRFTVNYMNNVHTDIFKRHDITAQQYNILRIIRGSDNPLSTADIRERMIEQMSDVSRLIDRLHKKKLIEKQQRPHDLRKVNISITDAGLAVLDDFAAESMEEMRQVINLNEDEMIQLSDLLNKLRRI